MSTLSAILCNYNHARFLQQALDSYAAQSPWPTELIIVDDGSTDGSREIILDFAKRYSWAKVILHEQNLGWHASTRDAMEIATGDYVYQGAADDFLLPGFFESAMEMADKHPDVGIICGAFRLTSMEGESLQSVRWETLSGKQHVPPDVWQKEILAPLSPWHSLASATVLRRDLVDAVGGYREELGFWADTFVIRAIGFQTGVCYLDRECTCFRVNHAGMSGTAGRSPTILIKVRQEALRLMTSPQFVSSFSPEHVRWWSRATQRSIEETCSEPVDQFYQRMLEPIFEASRTANGWESLVLWCSRKMMSALVRIIRPIVGRQRRMAMEKRIECG